MKTNLGILSMNEKYTIIDITDAGEETMCSCDNCGRRIRYIVTLKDSNGKSYIVGTECAKTLSDANISGFYSMLEHESLLKKVATAKNLIKNGSKVKIFLSSSLKYAFIVGLSAKGKPTKVLIEKTFDPFLGIELIFVSNFLKELEPIKCDDYECLGSPYWYFDELKKS